MVPCGAVVTCSAYTLSLALVVLSILHFYWLVGGAWGLAAGLGREQVEPTGMLRLGAGAVAIALAVAAVGVLGRIGAWGRSLPWPLFLWGTWVLVSALFLAALVNFTARTWVERLAFAPLALTLGVLALIVARSAGP